MLLLVLQLRASDALGLPAGCCTSPADSGCWRSLPLPLDSLVATTLLRMASCAALRSMDAVGLAAPPLHTSLPPDDDTLASAAVGVAHLAGELAPDGSAPSSVPLLNPLLCRTPPRCPDRTLSPTAGPPSEVRGLPISTLLLLRSCTQLLSLPPRALLTQTLLLLALGLLGGL